ncbi:hypothetical protein TI39_contig623g00011 [Zymoseptoria brevis]|uniref:Uncharacterized protein n=1 Tax=Zymoseptoria brevis TaxID=1047168 RepID=A0A0F4GHI8_9PEZI|nr:hypothetical protein TI39_contig623g00011 [Zymoseptoria brevis]
MSVDAIFQNRAALQLMGEAQMLVSIQHRFGFWAAGRLALEQVVGEIRFDFAFVTPTELGGEDGPLVVKVVDLVFLQAVGRGLERVMESASFEAKLAMEQE